MKTAIAFWNILLKDMRNYYLKPPNISWGIIFPFAWMLMFFLKSQATVDVRTVLPGVMAMSILFGTTSMLAVTITFERRSRSFDRLLLSAHQSHLANARKNAGSDFIWYCECFCSDTHCDVFHPCFKYQLDNTHFERHFYCHHINLSGAVYCGFG